MSQTLIPVYCKKDQDRWLLAKSVRRPRGLSGCLEKPNKKPWHLYLL